MLCASSMTGKAFPGPGFAALTFSQKDSSVTGVCFCPTVINASHNSANSVRGFERGIKKKKKIGTNAKENAPEGREDMPRFRR